MTASHGFQLRTGAYGAGLRACVLAVVLILTHAETALGGGGGERLPCGVPVARNLDAGAEDLYFVGALGGEKVQVEVADSMGELGLLFLRFQGPDGFSLELCERAVAIPGSDNGDTSLRISDCLGTDSGPYTVTVQGISAGPGNCALPLICGFTPGALEIAGEVDAYAFTGNANEEFAIEVTTVGNRENPMRLRLYDPSGTLVGGSDTCRGSITGRLQSAGLHTVLVSSCKQPPETRPYTLSFGAESCPLGPAITYLGLARSDDLPLAPDSFDDAGRPIYVRPLGQGFSIVLEARPGESGRQVGRFAFVDYDPNDPTALPDAQMLVSRPLGYGTPAVCDYITPPQGGVPASPALAFTNSQSIADAINDLGCRANNGQNMPIGRPSSEACTRVPVTLDFAFVEERSTIQFCTQIARAWAFPPGDTTIKARVRDGEGNYGATREIIVRVEDPVSPFLLADLSFSEPVGAGGYLFFAATDPDDGNELWRSDGTVENTLLIRDLFPGASSGSPRGLTTVNDVLYFVADSAQVRSALWRTFPDSAFTNPVTSFSLGNALPAPRMLTNVSGRLFFFVEEGASGFELWRSDGTEDGTDLVKTLANEPRQVDWPTDVGGALFFTFVPAGAAPNTIQLWRSDGTEEATTMVREFTFAPASGHVLGELTAAGGTLYFIAGDARDGHGLWTSDGTSDGTVLVKSFAPVAAGAPPLGLTAVGPTLFFSAETRDAGWELWKSDGSTDGTVLVKDINPGAASSAPHGLTPVNGRLVFAADDGRKGVEPWRSNGVADGTILIRDLYAGRASSNPAGITDVRGYAVFSADDGLTGSEMWQSDGTATGTVLVLDLGAGPLSGNPDRFTAVEPSVGGNGGGIFFRAQYAAGDVGLYAAPLPEQLAPPLPCSGDCDGSQVVTVDELVAGVALALNNLPSGTCDAFDTDHSGAVEVFELVAAVNAALVGCV